MGKRFVCSADEYRYLEETRNQAIKVRDKALTMKPGTAAYESHELHDGRARLFTAAMEAFEVRPGSQRSPDGSTLLSVEFQKDFDEFIHSMQAENAKKGEALYELHPIC